MGSVLGGNSYFTFFAEETILKQSESFALHLMVFFFPGDEQTSSESLLLFQILLITYLNKDLTKLGFFSGINYS